MAAVELEAGAVVGLVGGVGEPRAEHSVPYSFDVVRRPGELRDGVLAARHVHHVHPSVGLEVARDHDAGVVAALLGGSTNSFSFADDSKNPPVTLFIWGRKKVMPVNIKNMSIKEEEFSVDLNPIRATVTVSLEAIEGPNAPYLYTKALTEVMSLLNLANIGDIANTIVPA